MRSFLNVIKFSLLFLIAGRADRLKILNGQMNRNVGGESSEALQKSIVGDFMLIAGLVVVVMGVVLVVTNRQIQWGIFASVVGVISAVVGLALSPSIKQSN